MAAFKDHASFSAVNAIGGLVPPLPIEPEGDDISEQIEAHRHLFPIHEHMVVMDPPQHERARSLLSKLLTPRRLKENEDFMWRLADQALEPYLTRGGGEFISEFAGPFTLLVIADLLGVPEDDRDEFAARMGGH
nr:cytochrome P450 [Streptomyces sp. DSM 41633]